MGSSEVAASSASARCSSRDFFSRNLFPASSFQVVPVRTESGFSEIGGETGAVGSEARARRVLLARLHSTRTVLVLAKTCDPEELSRASSSDGGPGKQETK